MGGLSVSVAILGVEKYSRVLRYTNDKIVPDFAIPKLKHTRPEVFDRCTQFLKAAQKQLADAEDRAML